MAGRLYRLLLRSVWSRTRGGGRWGHASIQHWLGIWRGNRQNWVRSIRHGTGGGRFRGGYRVWRIRGRGLRRQELGFAAVWGIGFAAEALQLGERAIVRALGGIDATLQTGEAIAIAAVDIAERGVLIQ